MDNPQLAFPQQQFRTPSSEHCEAKTYAQVLTLLTPASSWMAQVFQEAHLYSKFGSQWNTLSKDSNKAGRFNFPFLFSRTPFEERLFHLIESVLEHELLIETGRHTVRSS